MRHIKSLSKRIALILFCCFAAIGVVFSGVYVAMRFHLTDVAGSIDSRNAFFNIKNKGLSGISSIYANSSKPGVLSPVAECQIMAISSVLPDNGKVILDTYTATKSPIIVEKMIRAVDIVTNNNSFLQDRMKKCNVFTNTLASVGNITASNQTIFAWVMSPEWAALRDALIKDKDIIQKASMDSGVPARTIVSSVISEQFRFFTANRESFKKYFEPLKILGNGTKFSYGVAGVKAETAEAIENNLKNSTSPFYLGSDYENIFTYSTEDVANERLMRLTDPKNHYYSYFYTGIFLKEIMHQWEVAGYPISDRPEVLATLFNLGFNKSVPKENPEVGGSTITINDRDYTFGGLSYEFYYSGELSDIFPIGVE
jgi:hypothetical protein